jgi:hypothetical protein
MKDLAYCFFDAVFDARVSATNKGFPKRWAFLWALGYNRNEIVCGSDLPESTKRPKIGLALLVKSAEKGA